MVLIFMFISVGVSFYPASSVNEDIDWIPNKHYSGIFGLMKLVLPKILPESLHKVWLPNKHYSGLFGLMKLVLPKILPESLHKV